MRGRARVGIGIRGRVGDRFTVIVQPFFSLH